MSDYEWLSFSDRDPERHRDVLVYCGHEECVKHITDFRNEDRSNNWVLWRYCPTPSQDQIDKELSRA